MPEKTLDGQTAMTGKAVNASPWNVWKLVNFVLKRAVIAEVIAVLLFQVMFRVMIVQGTSMKPTLWEGDRLFLNYLCYEPAYGDLVSFKNEERGYLVKRVIGMPGDTIEVRDSVVYRNGEPLEEDYIAQGYFGCGDMTGPVTVEEGHVFVMGDNRPDSYDSRSTGVGQVSEDDIVGGAVFRVRLSPFRLQASG